MESQDSVAARQVSWGLPGERLHDLQLLFNAASQCVILSCSVRRGRIRLPQVFFRNAQETSYTSIAELSKQTFGWQGDIAIEYPFSCEKGMLICWASQYDLTWSGTAAPTSALGLLTVNLERATCELWDMRDGVTADFLVQRIVAISADGREVFGVVGFPEPLSGGYRVAYFLTRLLWSSRTLEKLHQLPAVHF